MGINLVGDEGEVTVLEFNSEAAPEENAEEVAEETVTEEEIVEETTEEVLEEEAAEEVSEEPNMYTEEEMLRAITLTETKMIAELQKIEDAKIAAQQQAAAPAQKQGDPVTQTLEELYAGVEDDAMLTGKDVKDLLIKTFATLNNKSQEFNATSEAQVFDQGATHYANTYIPKMIQNFGLTPGSRDAQFVADSYIRHLAMAQNEKGRTSDAAALAANRHMAHMVKEFKSTPAPAAKPVAIQKKLASVATGGQPAKSMANPEIAALTKKVESGTASTMELIRALNTRK